MTIITDHPHEMPPAPVESDQLDSYRAERGTEVPTGTAAGARANVRRDPTQGQLALAQNMIDKGFISNSDGSYSLSDEGKQYNISFWYNGTGVDAKDGAPFVRRVTDPTKIHDWDVAPVVTEGNNVIQGKTADKIANETQNILAGLEARQELAKLPLDASQQKAFEGIMQAMSKSPPDTNSMNQIAKQFTNDPAQFKHVYLALLDENKLDNHNKINLTVDGTKPGTDVTFSSPEPPPAQVSTNIQINIPDKLYNEFILKKGLASEPKGLNGLLLSLEDWL